MIEDRWDFDINSFERKVKKLSKKQLDKAERDSLRRGIGIVARETRKNFRGSLPKATKKGNKYSDTLTNAVRARVKKNFDDDLYAQVHIMGTRKKSSGTFRARFFEKGTVKRKTRKGYNRGDIKRLNYFDRAKTTTENKVINTITDTLAEKLNKLTQ